MRNSTIKIKYGLCKGERCKDKTEEQPFAHNKLQLCALCNKHRLAEDKRRSDSESESPPVKWSKHTKGIKEALKTL